MHTSNELVAGFHKLNNGLIVDSGWIELGGWGFPEAAYVDSIADSIRYIRLHGRAKAGNIRRSGCHRLRFEGPQCGKKSRPSVSGGNAPALKRLYGSTEQRLRKLIDAFPLTLFKLLSTNYCLFFDRRVEFK